jgi:hypothetical protein
MMEKQVLSLYELNGLVRRSIQACLPDEYWVQAELSDVRSNYSGHCYLELVQKDPKSNSLVAKARGMIWSNVFFRLKSYFEEETGQAFVSGIKVLVKVTVGFHELYGFSLTIIDIDPTYTLGDMARRRKEILNRLDAEGILTLNKELDFPELPQRIAVISSATAAGYGDFCNQLENNIYGFQFFTRLFPAVMQGDKVESSIIAALDVINAEIDNWDVVVIIRGGGATSDLSGFDTYDLAANCAQFPLPIITGIGHERDDTVLDMISHTRVKTPTAAAEFLIARFAEAAGRLEKCVSFLYERVPLLLLRQADLLDKWVARIPARVQMRLQDEHFEQERFVTRLDKALHTRLLNEQHRLDLESRLQRVWSMYVVKEQHRLEMLAQQVKSASPDVLLKKGYSITLKNGKAVTDISVLEEGDELVTRVANGTFRSKVTINKLK